MIRKAESDTLYERDDGQGWKRIRRWRRGATETAAKEMSQISDMVGTTKEMWGDEVDGG